MPKPASAAFIRANELTLSQTGSAFKLASFCGVTISLALYKFFQIHQESAYVLEVLNGLKSASLGLIISAASTIILLALYGSSKSEIDFLSLDWCVLLIFLTMLFILRKWKLNPIVIIFISGIAGFAFYH